ncbi:DUF4625 domain-containing protein [Niabella hibiscisoli]|uniref:DUF4625 domain-containing protein n=1 Tax=Niabella hibiscisoli TaxID=1825928 RepID=UPI001F0DCEB6|nr:DUF4625 domain-containing protein [Niabella hibiscisoli]MCH5714822.1 DUF4625 domain-containing protein [Niabella hibiscisoli]
MKKFLSSFSIFLLLVAAVTSCNKNEDIVAKPIVTGLEVGTGNNKTAYAGSDLHIEGDIVATGTIENVVVEIHPKAGSGWLFNQAFTDGYTGNKNANFHEHIEIPANAAAGDYNLQVKVADKSGNVTVVESALKIERKNPSAALIFTKITGTGVEGHGDHFHGLAAAIEGASDTILFDEKGTAISNAHLHLEPESIYKIGLKTYNASGAETQNQYIANAAAAANYKAFLTGGSFILNPNSPAGEGAIFQTRETQYADGTTVSGATSTTGVISYFIVGHANQGEKDVAFVMRKLNANVKPTITRVDWNRTDYATAFAGTNELELKFEIHAEDGHDH